MSHTWTFDEWGAVVTANGDLSGEAQVMIPADKVTVDLQHNPMGDGRAFYLLLLPGEFLKAISREATLRDVVSMVENME